MKRTALILTIILLGMGLAAQAEDQLCEQGPIEGPSVKMDLFVPTPQIHLLKADQWLARPDLYEPLALVPAARAYLITNHIINGAVAIPTIGLTLLTYGQHLVNATKDNVYGPRHRENPYRTAMFVAWALGLPTSVASDFYMINLAVESYNREYEQVCDN